MTDAQAKQKVLSCRMMQVQRCIASDPFIAGILENDGRVTDVLLGPGVIQVGFDTGHGNKGCLFISTITGDYKDCVVLCPE